MMEEERKSVYKEYKEEKLELDNDIFAGEDNRRGRPEFIMPSGTEVLKLENLLEIDLVNWKSENSKGRNALFFMTIFWNSFLLFFIFAAPAAPLIFLAGHLIAGGTLIFKSLQSIFNRRRVSLDRHNLTISEGPFKLGQQEETIPLSDISQLYVTEYFTGTTVNNVQVMAYAINLVTKGNQKKRLLGNTNLETALYLEQEMERFLNIEDRAVKGEITE